jgi:hypothetical protein
LPLLGLHALGELGRSSGLGSSRLYALNIA